MVEMNVGDIITTNLTDASSVDGYRTWRVAGKSLRVTRVFEDRVIARGTIRRDGTEASVLIDKAAVATVNGVRTDGKRDIGVKPEDTPEMTHIAIDDPRIQWIFDDMGRFADERDWCSQYDELAEEFGIPGRGEKYDLYVEIPATRDDEAITISAEIRGQDEQDANRLLREHLIAWAQAS